MEHKCLHLTDIRNDGPTAGTLIIIAVVCARVCINGLRTPDSQVRNFRFVFSSYVLIVCYHVLETPHFQKSCKTIQVIARSINEKKKNFLPAVIGPRDVNILHPWSVIHTFFPRSDSRIPLNV